MAVIDEDLESRYGTQYPLGVMPYVQLQPEIMRHRRRPRSPAGT